jgi:ACS family tartrate transporter-like MFS transporter
LVAAFLVPPGPVSIVLLLATGLGIGAAQGVFWPIPFARLSREASGPGITVLNMVGNTAGLIMTPLIGLIRQETGGFAATIYLLAGFYGLAAVLVLALRGRAVDAPGERTDQP